MSLQHGREIGQVACGMSNGEDSGHVLILFDERKNLPLRHGGTEKRWGIKIKDLKPHHDSSSGPNRARTSYVSSNYLQLFNECIRFCLRPRIALSLCPAN